jgi:hypothetical protein
MFKIEVVQTGRLVILPALVMMSQLVNAAEQATPLSAEDILEMLKNEGVITEAQAEKASNMAQERITRENQAPVEYTSEQDKDKRPESEPGVTRVPYVPEYIKDEIRDEVRLGLKEDVVGDVMEQAKTEAWGVPGTNPGWTRRIKFNGDIRFQYAAARFADGNYPYLDYNAINEAGSITAAGTDALINTTEDTDRIRLRIRLNMDAKVTEGVSVNMRLVTGNPDNPISTNQTLGNYGGRYGISLDRAYIKFNSAIEDYALYLGRMPPPFLSTEMVWDNDLNFDGAAFTYYFNRSDSLFDDVRQFDPFFTVGAFSLQEVELSSDDKWLYGAQAGFKYLANNQNSLKMGLAYYYFDNITGIKNSPGSTLTNYTAPPFVTKGNTMFDISNPTGVQDVNLFALAAEYHEINLTMLYDIANLAPVHVILSGDFVRNIGYDASQVQQNTGIEQDAKTNGYDIGVKVGWPTVLQKGNWNIGVNYRYLERDAVVDSFSDSNFHLTGTDGKGYMLDMRYGIEEKTFLRLRVISANEIDDAPLGVMTVLASVNAKF